MIFLLQGTGKKRSFVEAMRPLVSTTLAMALFFLWILNSPNNILEHDPRCCYYLTGQLIHQDTTTSWSMTHAVATISQVS